MLIGHEVLKFCSTKTRGVITAYEEAFPTENGKFLRSADELFLLMTARHGLPIYRRTIHTHWSKAKYRSLHVPFPDRHEIYFAQGLPDNLAVLRESIKDDSTGRRVGLDI